MQPERRIADSRRPLLQFLILRGTANEQDRGDRQKLFEDRHRRVIERLSSEATASYRDKRLVGGKTEPLPCSLLFFGAKDVESRIDRDAGIDGPVARITIMFERRASRDR